MRTGNRNGFTLIELLVVLAIIALLASMGIPNLLAGKATANEVAATATLRVLSSAQTQVQASAVVDWDDDGAGEFAYFGELAGTHSVRGTSLLITPPVLSAPLGYVTQSRVSKSGYLYQIFLPNAAGAGVAEDPNGGKADPTEVSANLCESIWCAYAWPATRGTSGSRAFFVNQAGDILRSQNRITMYSGSTATPQPDAAFTTPGSIAGPPAVGLIGTDGERWVARQ